MNIKELAEQAGYLPDMFGIGHWDMPECKRFAELVAAAEREACAKAYEPHIHPSIVSVIRPKGDTK